MLSVVAVLAFGSAISAFAHAEPVRATPGDGAVLPQGPAEIVLEMSQDMVRQAGANAIEVYDAEGRAVATGPAEVDATNRRVLRLRLSDEPLPAGEYTVRWRTLSADDGDSAEGALRFRVDPGAQPSPGREVLKESLLGGAAPIAAAASSPPATMRSSGDSGTGWVLAAAVGAGMLVVGFGAGVLFGRKWG